MAPERAHEEGHAEGRQRQEQRYRIVPGREERTSPSSLRKSRRRRNRTIPGHCRSMQPPPRASVGIGSVMMPTSPPSSRPSSRRAVLPIRHFQYAMHGGHRAVRECILESSNEMRTGSRRLVIAHNGAKGWNPRAGSRSETRNRAETRVQSPLWHFKSRQIGNLG